MSCDGSVRGGSEGRCGSNLSVVSEVEPAQTCGTRVDVAVRGPGTAWRRRWGQAAASRSTTCSIGPGPQCSPTSEPRQSENFKYFWLVLSCGNPCVTMSRTPSTALSSMRCVKQRKAATTLRSPGLKVAAAAGAALSQCIESKRRSALIDLKLRVRARPQGVRRNSVAPRCLRKAPRRMSAAAAKDAAGFLKFDPFLCGRINYKTTSPRIASRPLDTRQTMIRLA